MYSVEKITTGRVTEYLLSAGGSTAKIAPDFGALITSFTVDGVERIYMAPGFYEDEGDKLRGGNPILFPACGRMPDKTYTLNGKAYSMDIHGFARDRAWQVESTSCTDAAELTLVLHADDTTRAQYPFEFTLRYTFRLKGNTLSIIQDVINDSDSEMPFSTGMHPYFCADSDKASVTVPSRRFIYGSEEKSFDGVLDTREDLDNVCVDITDTSATLDTGLGYTVQVRYEGKYTCVVVWSPDSHKDFVCVEPWSACPNALNTGENLIRLAPHAAEHFEMDFIIS